jgi:hypothetical protein
MNIKPSRFGSVESLLGAIDYCETHDIAMYGGGQFELGVGRYHIQALASLCYPDAPNDVAPMEYNDPGPGDDLPASPLEPFDPDRGICAPTHTDGYNFVSIFDPQGVEIAHGLIAVSITPRRGSRPGPPEPRSTPHSRRIAPAAPR